MKTRSALLLIEPLLACGPHWALASERMTEHTVKLSSGEKPPPAMFADMKRLTGHWVGEAFGGTMAGLYRLHMDGGWEEKDEVQSFIGAPRRRHRADREFDDPAIVLYTKLGKREDVMHFDIEPVSAP